MTKFKINWVHSLLKKTGTLDESWQLTQCLFGEHLLPQHPDKPIKLSQSWRNLTNAQILAWNALAQTQAGKSVLGTSSKISGANLYSRLNYWIVACGGQAISNPPVLRGISL